MTKEAAFRFYAELNDLLPRTQRYQTLTKSFELSSTVKDMIEAFGVPHTEVDLVVVNGASVGFDHLIEDGDRVSVYPMFESVDITPIVRLRPEPLRETRFVLDVHLSQLARYLRLLGFDSLLESDDAELARISSTERRVLLTRDVGVLKRSIVTHGYFVRGSDPRGQAKEVVERFDLAGSIDPFTRCMLCNGGLVDVDKAEIVDELPPGTKERFDSFRRCTGCGRVYWEGAHFEALKALIDDVRGAPGC